MSPITQASVSFSKQVPYSCPILSLSPSLSSSHVQAKIYPTVEIGNMDGFYNLSCGLPSASERRLSIYTRKGSETATSGE